MNPAAALQAAMLARLGADASVKAELGDPARIYANAPAKAVMPFALIAEVSGSDWSACDWYGRETLFDVHVWGELTAQAGGKSRIYAALRAIELSLRDASLSLTGSALVLIRYQNSRVIDDPDGRTLHGVATFRALTQET
jgi:hypothetical protein